MARDHARVNVTIWGDPDFRALPAPAQHLYLTLWTAPQLSYCGVHEWRPGRLAARSTGYDAAAIKEIGACLTARHFLVIDENTEECLIRSWMRFDGLMKQPRLVISCIKAYADVESAVIRKVLVHEMKKIRDESPGLACWSDPRVTDVLTHDSVSAKDLPAISDPFGEGFGYHFGKSLGQTRDGVSVPVSVPPTPAPAPAPNSNSLGGAKRADTTKAKPASRAKRRPDDWEPTPRHREIAAERGVDIKREQRQFCDHHDAKGSKFIDWNKAFNTWLRNARAYGAPTLSSPTGPEPARPVALRQCDTTHPHDRHRWEDARNHYFCQGEQ